MTKQEAIRRLEAQVTYQRKEFERISHLRDNSLRALKYAADRVEELVNENAEQHKYIEELRNELAKCAITVGESEAAHAEGEGS